MPQFNMYNKSVLARVLGIRKFLVMAKLLTNARFFNSFFYFAKQLLICIWIWKDKKINKDFSYCFPLVEYLDILGGLVSKNCAESGTCIRNGKKRHLLQIFPSSILAYEVFYVTFFCCKVKRSNLYHWDCQVRIN